ncbi:FAD-binding oxidoreductase [Methylobacterium aquaticum]|uniref:FAD-linked oxidase n=1 Tax=Methylobacterium aquaticum TaxID=270351 RepID=A0A0J6SLC9_9HYPH|nr:FAD-binding oxidoreductase [Methylobacterium aquaticum]KMO34479.1 FAD-linked oxidase [Methylobacterium aquaticum]
MRTMPDATRDEAVITALVAALGEKAVLTGAERPARNASDWSTLGPQPALAVVRPTTTEAVAAAMRICAAHGVPVVPQGGLTGLCGGARPLPGAVALSLERMTGIEAIDPASATMTVWAGTPLQVVQEAADAAGFLIPLDLGARGSCAIGGNASTNAGGNRVIRYGMTREMILGLEVVLPDGGIVTTLNRMIKNNAGYDLKHLFIGSEGTLGVITRLVLRLFPKPACTLAALCALPDYASVVGLLAAARRGLGPMLSAFEVMWPDYWETIAMTPGVRVPLPHGHAVYCLIEAQGTDETFDAPRFEAWLEAQAEAGLLADAVLSRSLADVKTFWGVRDACSEFPQVLGPHEPFDIGLPVAAMDEYVRACKAALSQRLPGAFALFYGHIGDGNLHIVAGLKGASPQPKDVIQEVVYGLVREFGGTVSAEHGIGLTKKPWLGHVRSEAEIALMRRLKAAMDPNGVLNPGKVV